ncbi:unnamed protein product [Nyctereutes procyonoides]|uniref:(raccoon dog) hypothetical protein n=1 Tax=Nyctereutes procyonoides TaxID=34880 RepID=A0A811XUP0_NYCPR|nr:unnamed protein product [Nyctereutes procyonoides]
MGEASARVRGSPCPAPAAWEGFLADPLWRRDKQRRRTSQILLGATECLASKEGGARSLWGANTGKREPGSGAVSISPVGPGEVVESAEEVCKFPRQQLSWWQAQESCEQRFGHLALAPPAGVLAPRLPSPIWVGQKEAPLRRPPKRQTYQRLQDSQSWPGQDVISRVNTLANTIGLLPDPLSEVYGDLLLAEACNFLGILERVLAKEAAPLGPAALLAVVHFLKRVTVLGAGEPEPLTGPWEQLGQGIVSVASLVLEEQLADAWLSVSEDLPHIQESADPLKREVLYAECSAILLPKQPRPSGEHDRCYPGGLVVQSLHLTEASTESCVFTMPCGHPEEPGHIRIPASEVKQLLGKAGALKSSLSPHRFLGTQVGSAIISSEVWDETGEVSTAVTFHLQHQAQANLHTLKSPQTQRTQHPPASPRSLLSIHIHTPTPCPPYPLTHLLSPCFLSLGGSWATTGCSVATLYQDSTTCFCNHSTNFAVLLQVYDVQRSAEEESLLRTLSFVGCGVSFCALATTFLFFLAARVPKSERATVHENLTFSLASAEGFLMASEWAKANEVTCVAVTAIMHLLFLVAFSWMLVEGLLLWSKVVAVSMRPGPRMTLCGSGVGATTWGGRKEWHGPGILMLLLGAPVAIVATTVAVSPHDYVATGHCWLNVHTDTIWAFVGPVLFVLTANTCILVRVVMVTVSSARRHARMLSPQPCLQEQIRIQTWATVKPLLVLLPVLGLSWLVGMLVHRSPTWAYAAVSLNSFQGPYIFLVYAAYNWEVRGALQRMTEKKATEAFTACSSPMGPGSHPRSLGPWEVALDDPVALAPARRHLAVRGTHGPRVPTAFSSVAEPERPDHLLLLPSTSAYFQWDPCLGTVLTLLCPTAQHPLTFQDCPPHRHPGPSCLP